MSEWQTARSLLAAYDNNLHDLRKFGFTFLTGLLAAESILLPSTTTPGGSSGLPDYLKLGVFFVTLLLIFALHLIDENYLVFEDAASTRALVLERELNLELTEIVGDRYQKGEVRKHVLWVYYLFAFGVLLLGIFVFAGDFLYDAILGVGFLVTVGQSSRSNTTMKMKYRFGKDGSESRDWSLGLIRGAHGDFLTVTLTNLTLVPDPKFGNPKIHNPIVFPAGSVVWRVEDAEGAAVYEEKAKNEIRINDNYTWLWDTKALGIGVFQIHPIDRPIPLGRKIIITGTPPTEVQLA
jgi:hypothetical protein